MPRSVELGSLTVEGSRLGRKRAEKGNTDQNEESGFRCSLSFHVLR